VARVRAPTKSLRESAATLLAAIHRDPKDLAARAVYADLLQELGDPRGEYIALQLRAGAGKPSEREIELATRYRAAWLGPLDKVVAKKSRFQNGFLYVVVTKAYRDKLPVDVLDHPEWRTVEVLDTHGLGGYARLVGDPGELVARMPHLRELVIDGPRCVAALEQRIESSPLTSLGVYLASPDPVLSLLRANKLPRLRALRVWGTDPGPDRLVELASAVPLDSFGCYLETPSPRAAISIGKLAPVVPTLAISCAWGKLRITRTGDDLVVTLVEVSRTMMHKPTTPLHELLDELGRERVVVAIDGPELADVGKRLATAGFRRG
jgi:uncharacterized protein (TIGR02996 family)